MSFYKDLIPNMRQKAIELLALRGCPINNWQVGTKQGIVLDHCVYVHVDRLTLDFKTDKFNVDDIYDMLNSCTLDIVLATEAHFVHAGIAVPKSHVQLLVEAAPKW